MLRHCPSTSALWAPQPSLFTAGLGKKIKKIISCFVPLCQWCLWNAAQGGGVAAFLSRWPGSLLPISGGKGCSAYKPRTCHRSRQAGPRLTCEGMMCCLQWRRWAGRQKGDVGNSPPVWLPKYMGKGFPCAETPTILEKGVEINPREFRQIEPGWTQPENLCRSHIFPPTLLKWIGRVWSELWGICSMFGGYIQRSKYFGIWGKA